MSAPNSPDHPHGATFTGATRIVSPDAAGIAEAAALILAGACIAVPTETVYGLAADATNPAAVARIYAAKGRPSFNPLIVHLASREHAEMLAVFDDEARALADRYWPGPLTLVLPAMPRSPVAALATAGLSTIALRVPDHFTMRALLAATGRPLAAPSANFSGGISPTTAGHVLRTLAGKIPLIIDGGPTERGVESTIVAINGGSARLLRHGPITAEALGMRQELAGSHIEAPGQLVSHYKPSKPLRLNVVQASPNAWLIGFSEVQGNASLSTTGDLNEAAASLYSRLHEADASDSLYIAVAPIPTSGLGTAINDRLARAAAIV